MLHSDGSLETLFSRADDANLMLGNDLVVDPADGSVYFTNTHNMFEVRSVAFVGVGVVAISSRSCALFPGLQRRTIGYAYLENSPRGSVWRYAARLPFTAACVADNMDCAATTRPQALLQSSSPMWSGQTASIWATKAIVSSYAGSVYSVASCGAMPCHPLTPCCCHH